VISDGLNRLTPTQRKILLETYFKRRDVHDAAFTLDLSPRQVKKQLHRALNTLREAFFETGLVSGSGSEPVK
jgi:DNA-directed RNA polymerase specialized sigma24 family protein